VEREAARTVLDASALLALLFDETGADRVQRAVEDGTCVSVVNWAEVMARLIERGEPVRTALGRPLPGNRTVVLVPFDEDQARETARLRPLTRSLGLSLADRACLALGRMRRLPVVTADREWRSLRLSVKIVVIR
jgi:PIN domain nuclease of toxin-antitoxin system